MYLNASDTFDIWSKKAPKDNTFTFTDLAILNIQRLIGHLMITPDNKKKTTYIEKMPEHILRIDSILKAFPKAKVIYLYRNWLEVAMSIETSFGSGAHGSFNWYGYESVKWHSLITHIS